MTVVKQVSAITVSMAMRMMRVVMLLVTLSVCYSVSAQSTRRHMPTHHTRHVQPDSVAADSAAVSALPDVIPEGSDAGRKEIVVEDQLVVGQDSVEITPVDTIGVKPYNRFDVWEERESTFSPDPTRAVWLSALFPGLGQIYNRRYWKLPIVIGAYLGLGYATSWNNGMLTDYTRAYRDIMDTDPSTNSYMDFFPPTISEDDLDKTWLTNVLKSRKNFYRRNRDLCILSMIGVYLVAMVDAYVDASLSHFDITPDLSVDVSPAVFLDGRNTKPSVGLLWALTF